MPRPLCATIHLDLDAAQSRTCAHAARRDAKVWAVVKANAYGHGLERGMRGFAAGRRPGPDRNRERAAPARNRLDQADPAAGGYSSMRATCRCWPSTICNSTVHCDRADQDARICPALPPDRRPPEDEHRHEPARLPARRLRGRLQAPARHSRACATSP